MEFALQKIATEEGITVEEKEVEEAIQKAKDEKERKHLETNRYLLASILRQQKTLDFLKNLWYRLNHAKNKSADKAIHR